MLFLHLLLIQNKKEKVQIEEIWTKQDKGK